MTITLLNKTTMGYLGPAPDCNVTNVHLLGNIYVTGQFTNGGQACLQKVNATTMAIEGTYLSGVAASRGTSVATDGTYIYFAWYWAGGLFI